MKKAGAPQTCWQYWSCVKAIRKKCPVYQKKYGKRCWFLAGCYSLRKREFENCWDCPWYIESSFRQKYSKNLNNHSKRASR